MYGIYFIVLKNKENYNDNYFHNIVLSSYYTNEFKGVDYYKIALNKILNNQFEEAKFDLVNAINKDMENPNLYFEDSDFLF